MPWHVKVNNGRYQVVKTSTGQVVGTHSSRAEAEAQLRALYASEAGQHNVRRRRSH